MLSQIKIDYCADLVRQEEALVMCLAQIKVSCAESDPGIQAAEGSQLKPDNEIAARDSFGHADNCKQWIMTTKESGESKLGLEGGEGFLISCARVEMGLINMQARLEELYSSSEKQSVHQLETAQYSEENKVEMGDNHEDIQQPQQEEEGSDAEVGVGTQRRASSVILYPVRRMSAVHLEQERGNKEDDSNALETTGNLWLSPDPVKGSTSANGKGQESIVDRRDDNNVAMFPLNITRMLQMIEKISELQEKVTEYPSTRQERPSIPSKALTKEETELKLAKLVGARPKMEKGPNGRTSNPFVIQDKNIDVLPVLDRDALKARSRKMFARLRKAQLLL